MPDPAVRRYRSRASDRAVAVLKQRMTAAEKRALAAALIERNVTLREYVGSLLTRHERWDLVEWETVDGSA
jgi:hypothetical protein